MKSASVLFVFFSLSFISSAATLLVPQDYPTVQGAVAASVAGDTILVSPGLYAIPASSCTLANGSQSTCGLQLHDRTILQGSGPAQTTFDFSGAAIGALLQNGTATVKLAHLQNAGTAIYAYVGSNLTVTNVIITNSNVGTELNQGNSYTIINTTIDGIHDPSQTGSGVDVPFGGIVNIQNNLVTNNDRAFTAGSFSLGTYAYNDAFASLGFNWGTCTAAGCTPAAAPASNVSFDPLYCQDLSLQTGSPARHAGNPAILNPDGTVSDLGAYGGPEAILPTANCVAIVPRPTVTSISPKSINRGQSLTVTVSGNNFVPGAILSFGGSGDLTVIPISQTSSQITAQVTAARSAMVEMKNVSVTNPDGQIATLPAAFRVDAEFLVFPGPLTPSQQAADEPSLAVDPKTQGHLVTGFNVLQKDKKGNYTINQCGWAESFDGGISWIRGAVLFPKDWNFQPRGDPWVRYSPSGQLFYSCMGASNSEAGIFLWIAQSGQPNNLKPSGLATDLNTIRPSTIRIIDLKCGFGCIASLDVPSFAVLTNSSVTRLVACWKESFSSSDSIKTAFSNDGVSWSRPPTTIAGPPVSGNAVACKIGNQVPGLIGSQAALAISWLGKDDDTLYFKTSSDGANFDSTTTLAVSDRLLEDGSTTTPILSIADALLVPGASGLRAVWQLRRSGISAAFVGTLGNPALSFDFGNANVERFLPSAGACSRVSGSYGVTSLNTSQCTSALFRYTSWSIDDPTFSPSGPVFTSGADLCADTAFVDSNFPGYKRLGEYTGAACSGNVGWVVWTDLRNSTTTNVKPEIWGAVIPLP